MPTLAAAVSAIRTDPQECAQRLDGSRPVSSCRRRKRRASSNEAPSERLLRHSASVLSDAELLSVLLQADSPKSLAVAKRLLKRNGGLDRLIGARAHTFHVKGISRRGAATVLAAYELAQRLAMGKDADREPLRSSAEVARYLILKHVVRDQEVVGAIFLDTRNRLIETREFFRGSLCRTTVEPGPILADGLRRGAAAAIIFHTHPSGDPAPSPEDRLFTRRIREAGDIVGLEIADHLIVTHTGNWLSLRKMYSW
jgi:DNA repair protein RadC